ncbi:hypothetical protein FALBO_241 [Fusarium albosuccineum]|uniref:DUF6536 domain-containing protein n=1 Tax=Fusarium albosuccineum TaxID=1237068 RepID=A0A8H4LRG5_9HYPO|nr:hypothetical protein FALBO_241 [Fusarium albosuccineum]
MAKLTGWRRTAFYLTILVTSLTILLTTVLLVSIFKLPQDAEGTQDLSGRGQSILWYGQCDKIARDSLWIHLAVNIISTGVLASSNFFMQGLVAPTRQEVDKAHARGRWVEIGVQSIRNFRFISWTKILFWFLFSTSSIPLHLIFNSCILESKGSNGFLLLVAAESFVDDPWRGLTPLSNREFWSSTQPDAGVVKWKDPDPKWRDPNRETVKSIHGSLSAGRQNGSWEQISLEECIHRYNQTSAWLTHYRHVIMVISNNNETSTRGWSRAQVVRGLNRHDHPESVDSINPLWLVVKYVRDGRVGYGGSSTTDQYKEIPDMNGIWSHSKGVDVDSDRVNWNEEHFKPAYRSMQAHYCLSEKYEAQCHLSISNTLLLIVCTMCAFKCVLCVLVLRLRVWGRENPLMTPGDAICSFITTPDGETKDMCTLSLYDLRGSIKKRELGVSTGYKLLQGPRPWHKVPRRTAGKAIPRNIWALSCTLITTSLAVGAGMFALAFRPQSIKDPRFGHDSQNQEIQNNNLESLPLLVMTIIANLPQLILSICYMAYNGLFTRMLAEFEWARYSISFQPLRVTEPRGSQRSTYRLQLPYRYSIPLLAISTILHWIYSNCIYVNNYESYGSLYPYKHTTTHSLQFSTKAILIALVASVTVAITPLFLAFIKLPGQMVLAGGNSAVISAACHCVPVDLPLDNQFGSKSSDSSSLWYESDATRLILDAEDPLQTVARRRLKWGHVLGEGGHHDLKTGHLAFGTEEQAMAEPEEGKYYSGI